jgi:hypothetical protein
MHSPRDLHENSLSEQFTFSMIVGVELLMHKFPSPFLLNPSAQ